MKTLFNLLLLVAVSLSLSMHGYAGDKDKKKKKKRLSVTRPHVNAVSADNITMETRLGEKSYTIVKTTEVFVSGQKSSIEEVSTGMEGEVVAGMDPAVAARISVYPSNNKSDDKKKKD